MEMQLATRYQCGAQPAMRDSVCYQMLQTASRWSSGWGLLGEVLSRVENDVVKTGSVELLPNTPYKSQKVQAQDTLVQAEKVPDKS